MSLKNRPSDILSNSSIYSLLSRTKMEWFVKTTYCIKTQEKQKLDKLIISEWHENYDLKKKKNNIGRTYILNSEVEQQARKGKQN